MEVKNILNIAKERGLSLLDAEVLLSFACGVSREKLITLDNVSDEVFVEFKNLMDERLSGVSVAHLTGTKEFYGQAFKVSGKCLIPRPETELIVDVMRDYASKHEFNDILDLGTGSGAIGLSCAHLFPDKHIICSDISFDAIEVAKENASRMQIDNVFFVHADLLPESIHPSVILTNMPYIGTEEFSEVDREVNENEPAEALYSGKDGLDHYRMLFRQVEEKGLFSKGLGLFVGEYGAGQSERIAELLNRHFGHLKVCLVSDLACIERFFVVSESYIPELNHHNVRKITAN